MTTRSTKKTAKSTGSKMLSIDSDAWLKVVNQIHPSYSGLSAGHLAELLADHIAKLNTIREKLNLPPLDFLAAADIVDAIDRKVGATSFHDDVQELLRLARIGNSVPTLVIQDDKEQSVQLELRERKEPAYPRFHEFARGFPFPVAMAVDQPKVSPQQSVTVAIAKSGRLSDMVKELLRKVGKR